MLNLDIPALTGKTLEAHTADELFAQNIRPVSKRKVLNLPSLGYLPSDKPEGLALLPEGSLAVLNDNDFGLEGSELATVGLGIITFDGKSNALDASDKDDAINIMNWPVLGMYQPDGITSFQANGATYYITANEGDAREYDFFEEEVRVKDEEYLLDPDAFPNAEALKQDETLGRLTVTTENGDTDGDGDYDQIYAFGVRSFSIRDAFGNLVYDSGDDFEQITAEKFPDHFNANNDDNEFDNRSDNKGPEPEGVATGKINGKTYAFVGLERIGGVMMYDVTDPQQVQFVTYLNNRNFEADAETAAAGDLGPEGLLFVASEDSPTGSPLLVVANEVSGSTSIYGIDNVPPAVTTFVLVNTETNQDIKTLEAGEVIDVSALDADQLSIRAEVEVATGSVTFALNMEEVRTENVVPYALFGDTDGDYRAGLMPGSYTLTATPYTQARAQGMQGTPLSLQFEVITGSAITGFVLVDAETDQDVMSIREGDVIDLDKLDFPLSIRADAEGKVGSVVFALNGETVQTENIMPYALFGDKEGDYRAGTFQAGSYALMATPYTQANGKGLAGESSTINFTVKETKPKKLFKVTVTPHPVTDYVTIMVENIPGTRLLLAVTDPYGLVWGQFTIEVPPIRQASFRINMAGFPTGIYILKAASDTINQTVRVVKQ